MPSRWSSDSGPSGLPKVVSISKAREARDADEAEGDRTEEQEDVQDQRNPGVSGRSQPLWLRHNPGAVGRVTYFALCDVLSRASSPIAALSSTTSSARSESGAFAAMCSMRSASPSSIALSLCWVA